MKRKQQKFDVVRKGYDAFGRGDIPGLTELAAFPRRSPGSLPDRRTFRRRGFAVATRRSRSSSRRCRASGDILRFEPKDFIAQGERVVVLGEETMRVKAT